MANKAFQRTYTQLDAITKATVSLKATGVAMMSWQQWMAVWPRW